MTATAVALKNGKVLVVGGENAFNAAGALDTAEIYDPATNAWAAVPGVMQSARAHNPVAIVLTSGKVLIAGGSDTTGHPVSTADLYDPAGGEQISSAARPRHGHRAARCCGSTAHQWQSARCRWDGRDRKHDAQ